VLAAGCGHGRPADCNRRASSIATGAPAKVPGATFFDLYGAHQGTKNLRVYASVQNLLDQQPPWDVAQATGFSLNHYDVRGRFARLGLECKFR
jgi:iron complex outermembrane recepter protein